MCFCSVVHRTVDTSARNCHSARTIHNLVCVGSSSRLCGPQKKLHVCTYALLLLSLYTFKQGGPLGFHLGGRVFNPSSSPSLFQQGVTLPPSPPPLQRGGLNPTSSSSIPSSRTTSQVTLPINKHCATPPTRGVWPFGQYYFSHIPQVMSPT